MKRARPDLFETRPAAVVPYDFVLEALSGLEVNTRAMFGARAVYVGEKVVFILRQKGDPDDGVWLAFELGREPEVQAALPRIQRIGALPNVRNWRKLAASDPDFEADALRACAFVRRGELLGKVPDRAKKKLPAVSAVGKSRKAAAKVAGKTKAKGV